MVRIKIIGERHIKSIKEQYHSLRKTIKGDLSDESSDCNGKRF